MKVSAPFRLWLPLGNVLLLVGVSTLVVVAKDLVSVIGHILDEIHYNDTNHDYFGPTPEVAEFNKIYAISLFFTRIILETPKTLGLMWFGSIIRGKAPYMLCWFVTGIFIWLTQITFNIAYIFINRQYTPGIYLWITFYKHLVIDVINAYHLFIVFASFQAVRRQEVLQPIGKGFVYIWNYFNNEIQAASRFFLTSEIILDVEYLLTTQGIQLFGVSPLGYDGGSHPAIVTEEIWIRFIRIFVNAIGIWLVATEKRKLLRWWCAVTFAMILTSTTIFVILTVQWRGDDIASTLGCFIMFPFNLLYRFISLYFCLKFTRADFSQFVL